MKHGVFFEQSKDGGYYEVWVWGGYMGFEYNLGCANALFSEYEI